MEKYKEIIDFKKESYIEDYGFMLCNFISKYYNELLEDTVDFKEANAFVQNFCEKIFILKKLIICIWELSLVKDEDLIIIIKKNITEIEEEIINYYNTITDYHYVVFKKNIFKSVPIKDIIFLLLNIFYKIARCCKNTSMINKTIINGIITNYGILSKFIGELNTKNVIIGDLNYFNIIKSDATNYLKTCIEKQKIFSLNSPESELIKKNLINKEKLLKLFEQIINTSEQNFVMQMMMMIIELDNFDCYSIESNTFLIYSLKLASLQVYRKYS